MSRNSFRCLFCHEPLARIKPERGNIRPLGPVPFVPGDEPNTIVVTCPKCGERRTFTLEPREKLKPAA